MTSEPGRLRIGFARCAPSGVPLAPECVAAVDEAAQLCEALGHHVEEAAPDCDWSALTRDFVRVFGANVMANIARATGGALPERELVEPLTYAVAERARSVERGRLHRRLARPAPAVAPDRALLRRRMICG